MPFSPKTLNEEDIKSIREFDGGILRGSKQFGISKERFKKIKEASSLEEAIAVAQPKQKEDKGGNDHRTDVSLSELKVKGSPVKFRIKDEDIILTADDLLTSYFIYLDMKRRLNLENSFSQVLVIGMKTTWSLTQRPIVVDGGEIQNG
jgi:hypothetical protein